MKKTVAVIFGGRSAEHDVSIITAHIPIIESLEASGRFDVVPVYLAADGSSYSEPAMSRLEYFRRPSFSTAIPDSARLRFLFDGGLTLVWPGLREKRRRIDVVFPAMHGTNGEDGSLMGLLRLANVAFVGCDLGPSAVAMDKVFTKQILSAAGVPVVPFAWMTPADWQQRRDEMLARIKGLHWPVFVKPVHLGSSIAISKAQTDDELLNAIEVAFHYDDKILVEEAVEPLIEITLPIIGNDELQLGGLERPLNRTEFLDFNDKYLSGSPTKLAGVNANYSEIPARIDDELAARVKQLGGQTYRILGCSGIARIDFLINAKTHDVFVNEVNTLPGSLYHHNWRAVGVSNVELVTRLIELAEQRFQQQRSRTTSFNSNILQHVTGQKTQRP
ncbi:MAG: D-alanine--D-alanine ligase [Candidatus Kerfeldbacteria bacterium]|nr:D-alanine--D-alanine ligase [Candidatus Kerfeldbacteria bacterium]